MSFSFKLSYVSIILYILYVHCMDKTLPVASSQTSELVGISVNAARSAPVRSRGARFRMGFRLAKKSMQIRLVLF